MVLSSHMVRMLHRLRKLCPMEGPDANGRENAVEAPPRWLEPETIPVGMHAFRVLVKLRPDVFLSDRQLAYGLKAVLIGQTVAEVRRLMAWQDQKAADFDHLQRMGMLP